MAKIVDIGIIIILLILVGTIIFTLEKLEDDNPNIDFYYYCPDIFVSQYYNCRKDLTYENLTGKYCNGTLVCENNYKIIKDKGFITISKDTTAEEAVEIANNLYNG